MYIYIYIGGMLKVGVRMAGTPIRMRHLQSTSPKLSACTSTMDLCSLALHV